MCGDTHGYAMWLHLHACCSDRRAAGTPADTQAGGGQVDTPAGAISLMGMRACAVDLRGEGGCGGSTSAEAGKMYQQVQAWNRTALHPHQWRLFKVNPSSEFRSGRGTEKTPVKDFNTRTKPSALAVAQPLHPNGHLCPLGGGRHTRPL